jgi:hypothetical protein
VEPLLRRVSAWEPLKRGSPGASMGGESCH